MALGVIILLVFGSRLRVSYRTQLTGCARDDGTGGASGVFRWAERIGIPVRLLEVPISEASQALPEPAGHCVLTMGNGPWSPTGEELDPVSWQSISNWLGRGNTLIVVTHEPKSLPHTFRQGLVPPAFGETDAVVAPSFGEPAVESRPETDPAPVTGDGTLTVESKGPRWNAPSAPKPGPGAAPPNPPPAAHDKDRDPSHRQLAGDGRGGVLFRFPVGRGAVYVLLDEFAWTNAGLDHGENARVLAERPGPRDPGRSARAR